MSKSQNTLRVSLSIEWMLSPLIRLWREKSRKTDRRRNISGSFVSPDSSIEQILRTRFFYQEKRWTLLNPRATSRHPRKGQSSENVVKISCPSGSFQSRSRVEHFESIVICIIFANYLKRSLANSCPEIGLCWGFENFIVPVQKMIAVAELTYSFDRS
jgi:hypothetical protein